MTEQTLWFVIIAALVGAALGFGAGRVFGGAKKRVSELEAEVSRQREEIAGYRDEVETHFKKTAGLLVSMAGTYKDLFEHLSTGYERLSQGSARELFKDRVGALLIGGATSRALGEDKVSGHSAEGIKQQDDTAGTAPDATINIDGNNQDRADTSLEKSLPKALDEIGEADTSLKEAAAVDHEPGSSEVADEAGSSNDGSKPISTKIEAPELDDLNRDSPNDKTEPDEGTKTKPN